jgi:hypothetical protein
MANPEVQEGIQGFGINEALLLKWLIALRPVLRHHVNP